MSRRFDYVKYDGLAAKEQEIAKDKCQELEEVINRLDEGREKSLALTHLEIVYMWIGKALRDECIKRNKKIEHVPERTNE